jgi:hypothetical protein
LQNQSPPGTSSALIFKHWQWNTEVQYLQCTTPTLPTFALFLHTLHTSGPIKLLTIGGKELGFDSINVIASDAASILSRPVSFFTALFAVHRQCKVVQFRHVEHRVILPEQLHNCNPMCLANIDAYSTAEDSILANAII